MEYEPIVLRGWLNTEKSCEENDWGSLHITPEERVKLIDGSIGFTKCSPIIVYRFFKKNLYSHKVTIRYIISDEYIDNVDEIALHYPEEIKTIEGITEIKQQGIGHVERPMLMIGEYSLHKIFFNDEYRYIHMEIDNYGYEGWNI